MGKKKRAAPAPKKKIKLNEQKGSQFPSVDPYKQTSSTVGFIPMSFETSKQAQEKSGEGNEQLKSLISEIQSLGSRTDIEAPMDASESAVNSDSSQVVGDSNSQSAEPDDEITFWKQLMDPNTNSAYFWNPKTNQVSWTLPHNAVIADDVPVENEEEADNPYAEYYKYYTEHYGKTEEPAETDETKPNEETGSSNEQTTAQAKPVIESPAATSPEPAPEPTTPVGFVGPVLPVSHDSQVRSGDKRKAESAVEVPADTRSVKKPRLKGVSGSPIGKSPQTPQSAQAEKAMRFQVSNMADELTRKLDYLHVTNEGLTDIQILNIQFQTRLSDWKEGGLSTKFMLSKLKTSAVGLSEYEELAAPQGWKIVWESTSCRYRYHNLSTGEATWQYPSQISDASEASGHDESADDTAPESPTPRPLAPPSQKVIGPQLPSRGPLNVSLEATTEPEPIVLEIVPRENEPDDMETEPEPGSSEGPSKEKQYTPYKSYKDRHREAQPLPPPPPKSKLTVEKLREKLYPSTRPKRPRTSTDELEEQPVATVTPAPSVIPKEAVPVVIKEAAPVVIKEVPPVIYKEGENRMEFISEFPLDRKARDAAKEESKKGSKKNDPEIHVRVDVIPERFPNAQVVTMDKSMVSSIMSKRGRGQKFTKLGKSSPIIGIKSATSPIQKSTPFAGKTVTPLAKQSPVQQAPPSEVKAATPPVPQVNAVEKTAIPPVQQAPPTREAKEATPTEVKPTPLPVQQDPPTMDTQEATPTPLPVQQGPTAMETQEDKPAPPHVQQAPTAEKAEDTQKVPLATVPPSLEQAPPIDNESELRERLLERRRKTRWGSATDQQGSEASTQKAPTDSQVDPETGAVEPTPTASVKTSESTVTDSPKKPTADSKDSQGSVDVRDSKPPAEKLDLTGDKSEVKQDECSQEQTDSSSSSESDSEGKTAPIAAAQDKDDDKTRRHERSRTSSRRSDRYSTRRHSDSDHDRYSDDGSRRRKKHSRRDYSSEDSHDERYSSRKHRSDRSRHDNSDDEHSRRRSSRGSRRSSRRHKSPRSRHHRSRSRDSHSPHKPKKSPKHKKVKKEKKKKHHKAEKVEKPEQEVGSPKTPMNVIVGKVGMISSKRTLGQDKKDDDSPKTPPVAPATMSATYYQQPSTGQVPYYNMDSYYQGYYNTGAYQQWGQGQWPSTSQPTGTVQPATGTIQYPTSSQYTQYQYGQYPASSTAQYATGQHPTSTGAPTQSSSASNEPNSGTTQTDSTSVQDSASTSMAKSSQDADNTVQTSPSTGVVAPQTQDPGSQDTMDSVQPVEETDTTQEASTAVAQDSSSVDNVPPMPDAAVPTAPSAEKLAAPETMELTSDVIIKSDELQVVHSETIEYVHTETLVEAVDQTRPATQTTEATVEPQTDSIDVMETEEEITECDMEIEDSSPSPKPAEVKESNITEQDSQTLTEASEDQATVVKETTPPPAELKDPVAIELPVSTENSEPSVSEIVTTESIAVSASESTQPTVDQTASLIPTITSPTMATASASSSTAEVNSTATADYATAYALAAQQQQAYNYAFQTNNYVQAAYSAYVQQTAAAYQAYGGYYPGYNYSAGGFTSTGSPYSGGFSYGTASPTTTTSSGRDYGKIAYELAQAKQNAADGSEAKKSEFALAGSKSKQMKNMMVKWSSFKKDDKPS